MKPSVIKLFTLICGMLFTLAAFPVFGQIDASVPKKEPLRDFGKMVKEKVGKKEVDLTAPFSIELQGTLDKQGRFDPETTKFIKTEGDENMIEIAKSAVEEVFNTRIFAFLADLGAKDVTISIDQTENDFTAVLKSSLETPNRAKAVVSMLNTGISIIKMQSSENPDKETELILAKSTKVESTGKDFLLKFSMPSNEFHGIIKKELEKVK